MDKGDSYPHFCDVNAMKRFQNTTNNKILKTMFNISVPTRETVNETNQAIFDNLESKLGFVPNLYATLALSNNALKSYLDFQGQPTSLKAKEKEAINLAVSQVNECDYCLAAHTAIGKMSGLTDEQVIELRQGFASFDSRLDALARFARETTLDRGKPSRETVDNLLAAGFTQENLVDAVVLIGDKTVTNYLHGVTDVPVDFPAAPVLKAELVAA